MGQGRNLYGGVNSWICENHRSFSLVSDIAFSTVLSIFIVESIDRYLDSKYDEKYNGNQKKLSWNLNFGPGTMGVAVRF